MKQVTVYTDGSCLGNPGPGGWACVLRYGQHVRELSGGYSLTTNNRMELLAAAQGLAAIHESCQVDLFTDSQYVRNGFEKGWLKQWKLNGWKNAAKKPVRNQDLWRMLDAAVARHSVRFHWVRGHAGNPDNERCDFLARAAAMVPGLSPDPGMEEDGGQTPL